MDGGPPGPGARAHRWRPVPWEVISVIFTVMMVGAVVCGLVLATAGEIREDVRALQVRMAAVERGQTAVEGKLEGLIEGFRKLELRVSVVEHGQARLEGLIEGLREAITTRPPSANE